MAQVNNTRLLFTLIVTTVSMVFMLISSGQCVTVSSQCFEGDGDTAQRSRMLNRFDHVVLQGAFTVTLKRGDDIKCALRGDRNLLSRVMTRVENGQLLICNEGSLRTKQPLEIELQVPHLTSFSVDGAHEVTIVDIDEDELTLTLNGANLVKVTGRAENVQIELDGSSILDASNLYVGSASVVASGTTSSQLDVNRSLTVKASGITEVIYSGAPKTVVTDLSGLAEVRTKE